MVVMEGTQADEVLTVTLQDNPPCFHQPQQGNVLFQALQLVFQYPRHFSASSQNPVKTFSGIFCR